MYKIIPSLDEVIQEPEVSALKDNRIRVTISLFQFLYG